MRIHQWIAALLLGVGLTGVAQSPTAWFDGVWLSESKHRDTRGACRGEYEEDNTLDLLERNDRSITGECTLNMSFFSDKHSSSQCAESDDSVATLDITYGIIGTTSHGADEVTLKVTLKKCVEDGSYHECDSVPRQMRLLLRKVNNDTVLLVGNLAGRSERTLQRGHP